MVSVNNTVVLQAAYFFKILVLTHSKYIVRTKYKRRCKRSTVINTTWYRILQTRAINTEPSSRERARLPTACMSRHFKRPSNKRSSTFFIFFFPIFFPGRSFFVCHFLDDGPKNQAFFAGVTCQLQYNSTDANCLLTFRGKQLARCSSIYTAHVRV